MGNARVPAWREPFSMGAMVVFGLLAASALHQERVGIFGDDAIYLSSAGELAQGRGYRVAFLPGSPLAGKYPPLYPALLAVASWWLPSLPAGLIYYKVFTLLLALPGIVFTARWLRLAAARVAPAREARRLAWVVLAGTVVNAGLIGACAEAMSEALFFTLLMATLWCLEMLEVRASDGSTWGRQASTRQTRLMLGWALALAILATHTRMIGMLLLVTVIATAVVRLGPQRGVVLGVAGLAALGPWWWWSRAYVPAHEPMAGLLPYLTSYGYHGQALREYLGPLDGGVARYLEGCVRAAVKGVAAALAPLPNRPGAADTFAPIDPSALILGTLILIGLWQLMRRARASGTFLLLYIGLATLWPWFNKTRFFVVIAPLLLLCAGTGLTWLLSRWPRARQLAVGTLMAVLALSNLGDYVTHGFLQGSLADVIAGTSDRAGRVSAPMQTIKWLRSSTPKDAVVLTNFSGPLFALHTGRDVLPYSTALKSPGTALADSLGDVEHGTGATSLTAFVQRARLLIGDRPLYEVHVCQRSCGKQAARGPIHTEAVFTEPGQPEARITIRRWPRVPVSRR